MTVPNMLGKVSEELCIRQMDTAPVYGPNFYQGSEMDRTNGLPSLNMDRQSSVRKFTTLKWASKQYEDGRL